MRVKISTNPPLPAIRAWFPLAQPSAPDQTIATFKSLLCRTISALRDVSPPSLRLSIDGFELLDNSELCVVRDGDLISIDACSVPPEAVTSRSLSSDHAPRPQSPPKQAAPTSVLKRKRSPSGTESDTSSSPSSESESESESESDSTSEGTGSESDVPSMSSLLKGPKTRAQTRAEEAGLVPARPLSSTFVPPGYGRPQTRARNLRRRRRRMYEREGPLEYGQVSGANAVGPGEAPEAREDAEEVPALMSLSLRTKNKAKNMKGLLKRPLPAKIIFDESTESKEPPRLVPPSLRPSLPGNVFVTSVDVQAGERYKREDDAGEEEVTLDYGEGEDVEAAVKERWDTLCKATRGMAPGTVLGYKALGIDPVTFTPGPVVTVARVVSCGDAGVVVRPMRAVSFNWSGDAEAEEHAWEEIEGGDWRML